MSQKRHQKIITASEVGEFIFCAKAWHLKRNGAKAQSPDLDSGTAFHAQHGAQVSSSRLLRKAGLVCALIAFALLICLSLIWYSSGA